MTVEAVNFQWLDQPAALASLQVEWQQLAATTGADIFLTPDWFALWWQHFGAGCRLACLVVRQGGALTGLLPFCIDSIRLGPIRLRVARLAGTDPHCMVFTLPVLPEIGPHVLRQACDHLLASAGCDAISLTPLSERAGFRPWIIPAAGQQVTDRPAGTHVMFELPDSFDAYMAGLSKNRRAQVRRDLRGLESRYAMQTRVIRPDAAAFAEFVGFHNRQWQAVGKGGHFEDWPGSAAFYSAVAERSRPGWGVRFDLQDGTGADGGPVPLAANFQLISGPTAHWRLPARTLDSEAEKLSIGKAAVVLMIEGLISSGIRRIEAGRGEYDYKIWLGGENVLVHGLLISPATAAGRLRLRLLLWASDLINLLHYRIWFLKLAPVLRHKLGWKPRPLWRLWIRTRV